MRIAISAFADDLDGKVNPVFGRCQGFIIAEIEGDKIKKHFFIENNASNSASGAGVVASQQIISQKVQGVISGNLGPNAFMLLQQSGIKLYQINDSTIKDSIKQLSEGKLSEIKQPSAQSKFGLK